MLVKNVKQVFFECVWVSCVHTCYSNPAQLLIVCLFHPHLGVLCVLRMCGVYVGHHLPPLHPSPMAVFRCQHLRMGPVCLAHRLVQVFFGLFIFLPAHQLLFTLKDSQEIHGCQVSPSTRLKRADLFFLVSYFFMQKEESVYPLYRCGSCLCTSKLPYGSKI